MLRLFPCELCMTSTLNARRLGRYRNLVDDSLIHHPFEFDNSVVPRVAKNIFHRALAEAARMNFACTIVCLNHSGDLMGRRYGKAEGHWLKTQVTSTSSLKA